MTRQRARLRALYQETAQGEWEYVEPKDAASSDPYDREGHFKGIPILPIPDTYMLEPDEARFIVAAHNALPALLDELDAMERERDRLRAENEQLRSKFDDLLKTVKPYVDKCERQDRLIIALVAGRNIDQLLDEKLGDKPSAD